MNWEDMRKSYEDLGEEEKREITSSGDFVDFLFQEESNQNTENTKKKNRTPENKNNK